MAEAGSTARVPWICPQQLLPLASSFGTVKVSLML
jgi:hypothetical protein